MYIKRDKNCEKQINFKSQLLNNSFITQYSDTFKIQLFQNEKEVEEFEQKMCCGDDKTWGSWVSVKEKFSKFPCYIVYKYVYHQYTDDYTAIYLTLEEAKKDLLKTLEQIDQLINIM